MTHIFLFSDIIQSSIELNSTDVNLETSQRGFPILRLNNFRYRNERKKENTSSWRCVNKNCKGRVLMAFGSIKRYREHNICIKTNGNTNKQINDTFEQDFKN